MRQSYITRLLLSIAVLAAACTAALPASAQAPRVPFRGQVVDSLTGAPIAGAVVRLPDAVRYTLTNELGWFLFKDVAPGRLMVVVAHIGYEDYAAELIIDGTASVTLRLQVEPIELEQIIVHGKALNNAAQRRATGLRTSWRSFDRGQIVASGAADAVEFLKKTAKVVISKCKCTYYSGCWRVGNQSSPDASFCVARPHDLPIFPAGPRGSPDFETGFETGLGRRFGESIVDRMIRGAPSRTGIVQSRTHYVRVMVYLDDRPLPGSLDSLNLHRLSDFHRVETFGLRGERELHFYTTEYIQLLATGVRRPTLAIPLSESADSILRPECRRRVLGMFGC